MFDIQVIACSRCGAPCTLATEATEEAQLLKAATRPETSGYCADCATTDFLQNQRPHLAELMASNPQGKHMLLDARVQAQFAQVMQAGHADARPEEINWQRVVDLWEMPFANKRVRRTGGKS